MQEHANRQTHTKHSCCSCCTTSTSSPAAGSSASGISKWAFCTCCQAGMPHNVQNGQQTCSWATAGCQLFRCVFPPLHAQKGRCCIFSIMQGAVYGCWTSPSCISLWFFNQQQLRVELSYLCNCASFTPTMTLHLKWQLHQFADSQGERNSM